MASPALSEILHATEEKWLNVLYSECKKNFETIHLPSHDHTHHKRVWDYAKLLMVYLAKEGMTISASDTEEIIISAFFHDQGMSRTFAKEHGAVSAIMCKNFCSVSGIFVSGSMDNILKAIENHDNKDYSGVTGKTNGFNLQKILNIADDLDALGTLGAYRYLEIYLLRGTDLQTLPKTIRQNIDSRFNNLSAYLGPESDLVKKQQVRYRTICDYFEQLLTFLEVPSPEKGPACVIKHITEKIIQEKQSLTEACNTIIKKEADTYCIGFFQKILLELDAKII